jgi:outer membrane protein OmpA-like peptidoglycan-associated protein
MTTKILAGTAALALLAGCAVDPNDPDRNTRQGTMLGAGLGAAIGLVTGDSPEERARNAAAGAVIGGVGGAITGSILDRQEAELRRDLEQDGVIINNTGDELVVSFTDNILFDVDSAAVKPAFQDELTTLSASLQRYPGSIVRVTGHTDNTGDAAYNQRLSERRAGSVANVLISNGVASSRIVATGSGEAQPVASNLTPEGRALNRRVDVVIVPTNA